MCGFTRNPITPQPRAGCGETLGGVWVRVASGAAEEGDKGDGDTSMARSLGTKQLTDPSKHIELYQL